MTTTILDLTAPEARAFFLREDCYINFELPEYFVFSNTLVAISDKLATHPLAGIYIKASGHENVNHSILSNKDGQFAWRKLQFVHPVIYVYLVHAITEESTWSFIQSQMKQLQSNSSIRCASMPAIPLGKQTQDNAQINQWSELVEQGSMVQSLDFEYVLHTDIAGCYASIYTHAIPWALHTKERTKKDRNPNLIGNLIDKVISSMSYGQTNGVPEGSVLMDFIAEIVLAYIDSNITKRMAADGVSNNDYCIIRYRDDYRVFVRDPLLGHRILRYLSEELAPIGMHLNRDKTKTEKTSLALLVKEEKLHFSKLQPPEGITSASLQQHLIWAHEAGKSYANTGALNKRLSDIRANNDWVSKNPVADISIVVSIASENPKTIPTAAALIARMIKDLTQDQREEIGNKILRKLTLAPNVGFGEIWLQRIAVKIGVVYQYSEKLCRIASNVDQELFNSDWLPDEELKSLLKGSCFFHKEVMESMDLQFSPKEASRLQGFIPS